MDDGPRAPHKQVSPGWSLIALSTAPGMTSAPAPGSRWEDSGFCRKSIAFRPFLAYGLGVPRGATGVASRARPWPRRARMPRRAR